MLKKEEMSMKQKGGQTINTNPPPSREPFLNSYLKEKDDVCKLGAYSSDRSERALGYANSDDDSIECTTEESCKKYRDCIGKQITLADGIQNRSGQDLTYPTISPTIPITGAPPFPGATCTRLSPAGVPTRYPLASAQCTAPMAFTGTYLGGGSRKRSSRTSKKNLTSSRMARRTRSTRRT
jgi:hypothetical protein